MIAYHFCGSTLRDGSPIPKDGEKLIFHGQPKLCQQGLHASIEPFDALRYAPGATLCQVECGGIILQQSDKLVCTERIIIKRIDATVLLWYFARMQALKVVHLWEAPQVVLDYLMTGDESIRDDAWNAAWDAARDTARDTAWYSAYAAARDAALDAACAAARDAALDAACAAARNAAWGAAWAAAWAATQNAAHSAARTAARNAAWDAAHKEFNQLVYEEFQS